MNRCFHVAPASARAAIAREGLDGQTRRHRHLGRPDECCVYLFVSLDAAAQWAAKELVHGEQAFAVDWDVWQVDVDGFVLVADESVDFEPVDGACYVARPVEPERLALLGSATCDMAERRLDILVAGRGLVI
jgi:hypothetical protein